MKNITTKIVFTLVIIVGLFLGGRASADTRISVGWIFGHHGGVTTYVDLFERHHYHRPHPAMRYNRHDDYYPHHRYERKHGHGFRRVQRTHHDVYYYHRHGIHQYCDH